MPNCHRLYFRTVLLAAILWCLVAPVTLADDASITSTSTPQSTATSAGSTTTHTVSVGAEPLKFSPSNFNASVGDIIEFRFYPQNHSVARAEYGYACIPYEVTGPGKKGFWSGFHPLSIVLPNPPSFQVQINDTNPMFFYCGAPGACHDDGMIGVVNANATQTFDNQLAFAKNSTLAFVPGEAFPSEGISSAALPSSTGSTSTLPTASPVQTSPPAGSTSAASSSGESSGLSPGVIAGISIGAAGVALLAAGLFYLCGRQRMIGEMIRHSQAPPYSPAYPNSGPRSPMAPFPSQPHQKSGSVDVTGQTYVEPLGRSAGRLSETRQHNRSPANESSSYGSRSPPIESLSPLFFPVPQRRSNPESMNPPNEAGFMGYDLVSPVTAARHDRDVPAPLRQAAHQPSSSAGPGPHELAASYEQEVYRPFSFTRNTEDR